MIRYLTASLLLLLILVSACGVKSPPVHPVGIWGPERGNEPPPEGNEAGGENGSAPIDTR